MRLIMMYKANKLYAARQPWLQANILSIVSKEIYHPINGKLPSFFKFGKHQTETAFFLNK